MTQNQINFAKLMEDRRHNLASEGISSDTLSETQRHNVQSENLDWYSNQELARHNQNTEGLNWYVGYSTADYNYARADRERQNIQLDLDKLQLDLDKFEEQKWKDLWATWNDSKRVQIAQQQVDAQIAEWINRYDLDAAKWYTSGYAKEQASTLRTQVATGADLVSIMSAAAKLLLLALK